MRPLILSLSGCVADSLMFDQDIDTDSNDYRWAFSYISLKEIDCDVTDILSDLKFILVEYPLEKMVKNISSHDIKSPQGNASLFSRADSRSKIAGAYDDENLMPFMDR